MNFPQRRIRHAIETASLHLHDTLDDASETGVGVLERGRRIGRPVTRKLRYRAAQAQDLAKGIGETATRQARRARRQAERHPVVAIGVAAVALAGVALLTLRAIRRRERKVIAPDHDYFGNRDD